MKIRIKNKGYQTLTTSVSGGTFKIPPKPPKGTTIIKNFPGEIPVSLQQLADKNLIEIKILEQ